MTDGEYPISVTTEVSTSKPIPWSGPFWGVGGANTWICHGLERLVPLGYDAQIGPHGSLYGCFP